MKRLLLTMTVCGLILARAAAEDVRAPAASDIQDVIFLAEGRPLLVRAHVLVDGKPYRAAWDAYVDRVMKFLDLNGDGVLDKDELDRMPPAPLLIGGVPAIKGLPPRGSDSPDSTRASRMTRDELASFLRKNGAAPFQFQVGGGPLGPYGARVINLGEPAPASAEALNNAIFALLDRNRDGKLSREELADAPAALLTRDVNDDEMLTPQELTQSGGGDPRAAIEAAVAARARKGPSSPPDAPVILVNAGESGSTIARRLLERYGAGRKKLTAADLGLDTATFERLDADRDGALDAEELAQFARRAPDVEVTIRLGKKDDKQAGVEGTARAGGPVAANLTTIDGGGARLEVGVTRIEMRAGDASNASTFSFNFRLRDQYVNQFKMADTDNNGYLDADEAGRSPLFRGVFKALDTDGDGMLYEKEMVSYLDKIEELQRAVREGCVTLSLSDKGNGIFEMLDTDHDGRLSVRELRGAINLVKALDRNGDGLLARSEVPRHFEARVRRGPSSAGEFGNVVVVAKQGYADSGVPAEKGAGPKWFRKMDINRDGDLSRREFLGTDADFKRLDADGDGLISAQEAEAANKLWPRGAVRP